MGYFDLPPFFCKKAAKSNPDYFSVSRCKISNPTTLLLTVEVVFLKNVVSGEAVPCCFHSCIKKR